LNYNENRPWLVALAAIVVIVLGFATTVVLQKTGNGVIKYGADVTNPTYALNVQTVTTTYDVDTQYLGKCAVVTPPSADPCDAAQGTIRYSFFGSLVNADQFKKWKSSAPLDYARLTAHMNAPVCSLGGAGLPQDMKTFMGAALYSAVQAYACALGTEPIVWPAPNPPRTSSSDKTAPTAPGPITVTPNP